MSAYESSASAVIVRVIDLILVFEDRGSAMIRGGFYLGED